MTAKFAHVFYASAALNVLLGGILMQKGVLATSGPTHLHRQAARPSTIPARESQGSSLRKPTPWQQLYSTNFHEFSGSLRLAGCPEPIIRNMVAGALNRHFAARMEPLRHIDDFWLDGDEREAEERRRGRELVEVELQRQSLIEELLHIPWHQDPWLDDSAEIHAFFTSFLGHQKAQSLGGLFAEWQFEAAAEQAMSGDFDSPAGLERARELAAGINKRVAEVLTPEETDELGIRMFVVDYFDVWKEQRRFGEKLSGAELREVLRILKPDGIVLFDMPDALRHAQPQTRSPIEKGAALRAVLGDRRFSVFLQHHNGDFDQMPGHSDAGRPSPEVYLRLFELRQSTAAQMEAANSNPDLEPGEREQRVAEVLQAAHNTASGLLGSERWKIYLQGGGSWLATKGESDAK